MEESVSVSFVHYVDNVNPKNKIRTNKNNLYGMNAILAKQAWQVLKNHDAL